MLNVTAIDTERCSTLVDFPSCSTLLILECAAVRKSCSGPVRFLRQMCYVFYQHFAYLMHYLVLDVASKGYLSAVWLHGIALAVILFSESYFARWKLWLRQRVMDCFSLCVCDKPAQGHLATPHTRAERTSLSLMSSSNCSSSSCDVPSSNAPLLSFKAGRLANSPHACAHMSAEKALFNTHMHYI